MFCLIQVCNVWPSSVLPSSGIVNFDSRHVLPKSGLCYLVQFCLAFIRLTTFFMSCLNPFCLSLRPRIRLPFYMLNKQCLRFDILKKNFEISFLFRVWARYKISLVFRLSLVCSKFKFMLSAGIQFVGLKTTSHGKSDLKIHILRSDLPCEVSFRPKS